MLQIDSLIIETTRRCNLSCGHCLRGMWQNIDMSMDHIESLLSEIGYIGTITFSGGEPGLAPNVIADTITLLNEGGVDVSSAYVATNGTVQDMEFIHALLSLAAYVDEELYVKISRDEFHEMEFDYHHKRSLLRFLSFVHEDTWTINNPIAEGNANNNGLPNRTPNREERFLVDVRDDGTLCITEGNLYLNVHGDIIAGCDWSYESQDEYKITNVCRSNWVEELTAYVMEHKEEEWASYQQ